MPIPSDIRDAVRKELESRALRLDSRAVFDHRTNMARAKIMLMLQHGDQKQLAKKNRYRAKIHQQFHEQQQQQQQIEQQNNNTNNNNNIHRHQNENNNANIKSIGSS